MPQRGFLSHLDLNVADPAASIAFYGLVLEYLGYERHHHPEPDRAWWSIGGGDAPLFGIEVRRPAEPSPRNRHERYSPGIDHLAFHTASRDDVDGLHRALVDAGYDVVDRPAEYDYTPGYYAVAFDDPNGIRIEVVHEPPVNR